MLRGKSCQHHWAMLPVTITCVALTIVFDLSGCGSTTVSRSSPVEAVANKPSAAVLGYVWDSRLSGLRVVSGSLGAAHLENPVSSSKFSSAVPCANKNFALLVNSAGELLMMRLPSGQSSKLSSSMSSNSQIELSPSCSNALIYSNGNANALLINGLPSSPQIESVSLPSPTSMAGIAVSDQSSILLASLNSDGSAFIQIVPAKGPSSVLQHLQRFGAMAFMAGADSAVIADSGKNVVLLGTQLSASPSFTQLASSAQGVSNPLAVSGSADGHFALVASGDSSTVLRFDLSHASPPATISCACRVSELIPLAGNAVFQLTDPSAGTIFALDGDSSIPKALFIPTDRVESVGGGAQ